MFLQSRAGTLPSSLGFTAYAELSSMKEKEGACTSKPQQWHVRRGTKIDPQRWMQLNFSKPSVGKESTTGASLCHSQLKDSNFPIISDIIPSHYFVWNVLSCEIRPLTQFLLLLDRLHHTFRVSVSLPVLTSCSVSLVQQRCNFELSPSHPGFSFY